jgi:hypothetical protein
MTLYKFWDCILDDQGRPVSGATITVSLYPNGVATIYADPDGDSEITGAVTDSTGYFEFYCASGNYTLVITGAGVGTRTLTDITIGQASIWGTESANLVFASPNGSSGEPNFRALVAADLPMVGTWVDITNIETGWTAASEGSNYGNPAYLIDMAGTVHLRGGLTRDTGTSSDGEKVLTLPAAAWPSKDMAMVGLSDNGAMRQYVSAINGGITIGAGEAIIWLSGCYPGPDVG